ncbi:hypothetical protein OC842_002411 [Tilletia horrida]|uniref:ATP-dependent DNA helicase n=1 Tax=Tilletia horrida TaxID=155126 RepID=A0AAN6GI02_9BASI|nr:hypothetical protein OC842_002411 [Tilletia horrida]
MAEIDQALRIGRQNFNTPFGGMNVLFAGDLCQLPPVGAAALYSKTSLPSRTAEARTMMELGRAAWQEVNEVVNFTEQMRMQDADMAATLRRLRVRRCTQEDVELLNSNVLKSAQNPSGTVLHPTEEAIVLTRTNETVRALNHQKATETALSTRQDLVVCSAQDKTSAQMCASRREALLNYNGTGTTKIGLGRIPLYKGMPVVYRGNNQSVALGITNGAFATVESWDVVTDKWGHKVARGVVLRFGNNEETFQFSNLNPSTVPILPSSTNFKFSTAASSGAAETTVVNVSRRQLPIQPGFAMTVHSAQGITSPGPVVVDLRRGGFEAPPLPIALRNELRRLDKLADVHELPSSSLLIRRPLVSLRTVHFIRDGAHGPFSKHSVNASLLVPLHDITHAFTPFRHFPSPDFSTKVVIYDF